MLGTKVVNDNVIIKNQTAIALVAKNKLSGIEVILRVGINAGVIKSISSSVSEKDEALSLVISQSKASS